MQKDTLSQEFSKLSTKEDTKLDEVNDEVVKKKVKSKTGSTDKTVILERLRRLTKDPEQSKYNGPHFVMIHNQITDQPSSSLHNLDVLFVIQEGCKETFARNDFNMALQSIKQAFYIRDYVSIFTTPSNLPVYTAAYIPGRALCYYEIFRSHTQLLRLLAKSSRIYLPGSGSGSELIGMSAAMLHVPPTKQNVQLYMQDIGDWSEVLDRLEESVRHQWKLDSNQLQCSYEQGDVLEPSPRRDQLIQKADLITFMFVMNELFVNKAKSMALIQSLVSNMKKGAYLLVVDSAGSFSHLKIGDQTYMIYTLLDAIKSLEKVISEDSKWYRYPAHLQYPLDIQNMRYFLRLYRKL